MISAPAALGNMKIRYEVHSIAIQTACFEKAFDFYVNVLGLQIVRPPFRFGTRMLAWLDGGGILIELFSVKENEKADDYNIKATGVNHVAFVVDNLDAVVGMMNAHNVKITKGPMTPRSGDPRQPRILFIEGPDATSIQFREREK